MTGRNRQQRRRRPQPRRLAGEVLGTAIVPDDPRAVTDAARLIKQPKGDHGVASSQILPGGNRAAGEVSRSPCS